MNIETERLLLFPLTGEQLQLLITDVAEFEKQTAYHYCGEVLEGELYDIFKGQIEPVKEAEENYVWLTFWMIALKSNKTIIGSSCFKNNPSKDGSVEIGYGINSCYESRGYMTEAVRGLLGWALKQPGVLKVIAEVDKGNIASSRVLQKNGFSKYKSVDNFDWYESGTIK